MIEDGVVFSILCVCLLYRIDLELLVLSRHTGTSGVVGSFDPASPVTIRQLR
jgi:hypothetical protein